MVYGLILSYALSLISCRCCSLDIFLSAYHLEGYYIISLLTTLSKTQNVKVNAINTQTFTVYNTKVDGLNCSPSSRQ